MPAVLRCLEGARKSRNAIQEGTLTGAAVDSWLPNQFEYNDGSQLVSEIRLNGPKPARTSVLSLVKRHSFHATKSLNMLLLSKRTEFCSDPQLSGQ